MFVVVVFLRIFVHTHTHIIVNESYGAYEILICIIICCYLQRYDTHDETTKIKDRRQMIRAFPGKAVDYIYSFFMHIA